MKKLIKKNSKKLLKKKNVVSVGVGYKHVNGRSTGGQCIVVGVVKKVAKEHLSKKDLVPKTVSGVATDVIEIGEVKAYVDPTQRIRPAPGGVSIGHFAITAGTLACVVKDPDGKKFILSNNHVLANSNDASIGDAILQPGPYDGGEGSDLIARLHKFIPIVFQGGNGQTCPALELYVKFGNFVASLLGSRFRVQSYLNTDNVVDCALAEPIDENDVAEYILEVGQAFNSVEAQLGMPLHKYGRTTQYTEGEVLQLDATVQVSYGGGNIAVYVDQIISDIGSDGGDSGSLVVHRDVTSAVGLLFAGSDTVTILNPIDEVLSQLGVTF